MKKLTLGDKDMVQFIKTFDVEGHLYEVYNCFSKSCTMARAKLKGADWFHISANGFWNIDSKDEREDICQAIIEMEAWRMEHGEALYMN